MSIRRFISAVVISSALTIPIALAQKQDPADEPVRISTELVQTGVVILDKQGKFVDGLRREDFILKVDGQQLSSST
jgi:hypothetical protein